MSEDKITGTVSLEETAVRLLLEKHLTLTTAESCTGGMCASRIVNVSGASGTLMQGIVTYSNEAKEKYLHVKHETLLQHGAVSHETAYEMARGCVDVCGTDCGIATTGIAGPGGGTPEKPVGLVYIACAFRDRPVGLVYIACAFRDRTVVKKLNLKGDRSEIRTQAADCALRLLIETCGD